MSGSGGVCVFRVDLHALCRLVCLEVEAVHQTRSLRSRRPFEAVLHSAPTVLSHMCVQRAARRSSVLGAEPQV